MLSGAQQRQIIEPFCISVMKRRVFDAGATNLPSCEQVLMVEKASLKVTNGRNKCWVLCTEKYEDHAECLDGVIKA